MPILRALVEAFEADSEPDEVVTADIVAATGLPEGTVKRGLRTLQAADEPYFRSWQSFGEDVPVVAVTERARRAVGQWPTAEALTERLVVALEAAAEREPDQEKGGRLRALAAFAAGAGRDIVTGAVAGAIGGAL